MDKVRIGILGTGVIIRGSHLLTLQNHPQAEVVAAGIDDVNLDDNNQTGGWMGRRLKVRIAPISLPIPYIVVHVLQSFFEAFGSFRFFSIFSDTLKQDFFSAVFPFL